MAKAPTLLEQIESFLDRNGMPPTRFGTEATNDRHLVFRLRAGRDIRLSTVMRVIRFMEDYEKKVSRRVA